MRRASGADSRTPDDTLKAVSHHCPAMEVTADVVGEGVEELSVADDATYGDVCRAAGYSPHEVAVLVDGRTVPEDRPVEADEVRILRLLRGG